MRVQIVTATVMGMKGFSPPCLLSPLLQMSLLTVCYPPLLDVGLRPNSSLPPAPEGPKSGHAAVSEVTLASLRHM